MVATVTIFSSLLLVSWTFINITLWTGVVLFKQEQVLKLGPSLQGEAASSSALFEV